jgi:hypothetical protein
VFYTNQFDKALRFGDVIRGFVSSVPKMTEPDIDYKHPEYVLELSMPRFCAVMSPCCSIGDSTITLTPLVEVQKSFYKNPYFVEDLTNINRTVPPEKSVAPETWEGFSDDEKNRRRNEGNAYALLEFFIYAEHTYLPKYKLKVKSVDIETSYYMIDFRRIFRVSCSKVRSPEESPIDTRILELSVDARRQLREKISQYYSRVPNEDLIVLNA